MTTTNTVTLELTEAEVDALVTVLDQTRNLTCGQHCNGSGCDKIHLRAVRRKLSRLVLAHPAEL